MRPRSPLDARRHVGRDVGDELEAFRVRHQRQRSQHVFHEIDHGEGRGLELQLVRFDLGQVENVVEQRQERRGRGLDRFQALALIGIECRIQRELGHADDAVHRCPNLMTHVGEEFALRPASFHGLVAGGQQLGIGGSKIAPCERRPPVRGLPAGRAADGPGAEFPSSISLKRSIKTPTSSRPECSTRTA